MYISIKYERYERLNNTILLFFGSCQNCMSSLFLLHKSTRCIYNVTVLAILECFFLSANHGGQQYFPVLLGPSTLKSISPALIIICQYIQCHTQTYLPIIELVWVPKYWAQIFLGQGLSKDLRPGWKAHFKPI